MKISTPGSESELAGSAAIEGERTLLIVDDDKPFLTRLQRAMEQRGFVVETAGFNDRSWLDRMGHPHSTDLHVTERFRRIDFDHMQIDFVIEDAKALTKPWTVTRKLKREKTPAWAEYFCHEANNIVILNKETYFIREDGVLQPSGKNQPPPDLSRFESNR